MTRQAARRAVAALLFAATLTLYLAYPQRALFSDGAFYVYEIEHGELRSQYLVYFPLVEGIRRVLSIFADTSVESALRVVSALGGAAGVLFTFLTACELTTIVVSTAAALTLAFFPGFWFAATATEAHAFNAGCVAFLAYVLVRLTLQPALTVRSWLAACLASFLAPASHPSGVVAAPSCLLVLRPVKRRIALLTAYAVSGAAILLGLALRASALSTRTGFLETYAYNYTAMFTRFDVAVEALTKGLSELVLFAVPASPLFLYGLFVLSRRQPLIALSWGIWIAGYLVLCAPINAVEYGSYYVAIYGLLSILAFLALESFAASPVTLFLAIALAFAPAAAFLLTAGHRGYAVLAWAAASLLTFLLPRLPGRLSVPSLPGAARLAAFILVPAATCVLSVKTLVRTFPHDPVREHIAAVRQAALEPVDILLTDTLGATFFQWRRYYAPATDAIVFSIIGAEGESDLDAFCSKVTATFSDRLASGHRAWIVGRLDTLKPTDKAGRLLAALEGRFDLHPVPNTPFVIHELALKPVPR